MCWSCPCATVYLKRMSLHIIYQSRNWVFRFLYLSFSPPRGCSSGAMEILINGHDVMWLLASLSLSHLCLSIVQNSKSDGLHLLEFPMPMASLISLWFDHLFMWGRVSYLWCLLFVGRCTSEVGVSEILIPRLHSKEFVFYVC